MHDFKDNLKQAIFQHWYENDHWAEPIEDSPPGWAVAHCLRCGKYIVVRATITIHPLG